MPRPKKETKIADPSTASVVKDGEKRRIRATMAVGSGAFNLLESRKKNKEITRDLMAKAGMASGFKTAAEVQRAFLPVPWLAFQWATGCIGIPLNTVTEFIGQENVGKSSIVFSLVGHWIKNNIPCFWINSEPKMLEASWTRRLVGSDPLQGHAIQDAVDVADEQTFTLDDMDAKMREWIHIQRFEQNVPLSVPIVIVVDTVTKLLNPEEAKMLVDDKARGTAMQKGVADVSQKPGVTAKWLHEWTRLAKSLLERYNATVVFVSGQNTNMNAGASSFSPDGGASLNKTKTGGCATNQTTALQVTVTHAGMWKDSSGDTIGRQVKMRVVKNSYGGVYRSIVYGLRNDKFSDSDAYVDQALDMDETICNLLVKEKMFGLSVTRKLYTSDELGVYQESAHSLAAKIDGDDDLRYRVGAMLKINGYEEA